MKIVVIGTRGFPEIQGGVETHCEQLYPRLAELGAEVTVMRRACYVTTKNQISEYKGVRLVDTYCPKRKSLEAIVHSTVAVFKARSMHPDLIHIHAVGPSLVIPLARLLGLRVVATNHGPDYDRQKWGRLAKAALRLGEWCQAHFAQHIIVISQTIAGILRDRYGRTEGVHLIFNGVNRPITTAETSYISSLGLEQHRYVVAVARFVPEKRLDLLAIEANHIAELGYKLVFAGDADIEDEYSRALKAKCKELGVVTTGFIKGEKMRQLMTHAALFVLPSTHEGLSISLLEAMSYGLDVLLSDIPANKLGELSANDFFHVDDRQSLHDALTRKLTHPQPRRNYDMRNYDWDNIARQTFEVYQEATGKI